MLTEGSWHNLCTRKIERGLGFRDIHSFNKTLLAKQGWKMLINPSFLLNKFIHAIYYSNSHFMAATLGKHPCFYWRGLIWGSTTAKSWIGVESWNRGSHTHASGVITGLLATHILNLRTVI